MNIVDCCDKFKKYTLALSLVNASTEENTRYLDGELSVRKESSLKAKDTDIVHRLTLLIEEVLCAPSPQIPFDLVEKMKGQIQAFLQKSKEIKEIRRTLDPHEPIVLGLNWRCQYLEKVLFEALKIKLEKASSTLSLASVRDTTIPIETILQKPIAKISERDMTYLHTVRQTIFIPLKVSSRLIRWAWLEEHWLKTNLETKRFIGRLVPVSIPALNAADGNSEKAASQIYTAEELAIRLRVATCNKKVDKGVCIKHEIQQLVCGILECQKKPESNRKITDYLLNLCRETEYASSCERLRKKVARLKNVLDDVENYIESEKIKQPWAITILQYIQSFWRDQQVYDTVLTFFRQIRPQLELVIMMDSLENHLHLGVDTKPNISLEILPKLRSRLDQFVLEHLKEESQLALYQSLHQQLIRAIFGAKADQQAAFRARFQAFTFKDPRERKPLERWEKIHPTDVQKLYEKIKNRLKTPYDTWVDSALLSHVEEKVETLALIAPKTPEPKTPAQKPVEVVAALPPQERKERGIVVAEEPLKPVATPPFKLHGRVVRWFRQNPATDPFINDPQYTSRSFSSYAKSWIYAQHNFAKVVDYFVEKEGIKHNNECSMVGEMTIDNETRRGLFTYVKNQQGIVYHRYLTLKADNDLTKEYEAKGYYTLDFPPLENLLRKEKGPIGESEDVVVDDNSFVESITKYLITIKDPKNRATIRLCRLNP